MLGVTDRIIGWLHKRGFLTQQDSWLARHFYRPVHSGVNVTEFSAMRATAVFSCVRLISGTIASLPFPVYRRLEPRGKQRARDVALYKILHDRPNDEISSYIWRQLSLAHMLLWGNAYSEIEYEQGRPVALWPLPPWKVSVLRNENGGKFYEVTDENGQTEILPSWRVLHYPNITLDGIKGMSCIQAGAEAIGLSLAAEEFGARFFGEGANVGGIIEYPGKLKEDSLENFKKSVKEGYSGLGKSHRLMLLEEGLKYHRVGIPPNEAQFLETRKFQVAEIGRLFGISQLHKIGDLERATFSNIEEQNIDFVVDTIRPLLVNIEQETNYKLFNDQPYFAEFVVDGLLRGNIQNRYQAYSTARQWGWMSANDILELENQNPIGEQGDIYLVPMNMVPADQARLPDPAPVGEQNEEGERTLEKRNLRAAQQRDRTARSYRGIFESAASKVVQRETQHILKAVKKHFGERSAQTFEDWMEDYYREFPAYMRRELMPAFQGLAEAIQAQAAQEIGEPAGMTPEMEKFADEYMDAYIARHIGSSQGQLRQILEDPEIESMEAIEQRMEEWEERRPGKVAMNETVQLSNAIAKTVFAAAGITQLRWHALGSKTCPFCQELDGRVVGVDQPFVPREGGLDSDDGTMRIYRPTMHPPLHQGCVCQVIPERG